MRSGAVRVGVIVVAMTLPLQNRPATLHSLRAPELIQGANSGTVVIAEVLFAPAAGDTSFVELANVGATAVELSSFVLKIDTLELPLPKLAAPVARDARVLVRFDGRGTSEGNVVHAPTDFGLRAEGGSVTLLSNEDRVLDRVAWGDAIDAIVPVRGGMPVRRLDAGSSFGRPPGANHPGANTDWVVYPPDQVTPGRPNPLPAVAQLLPLYGAILQTTSTDLSWYPVPGAVRYRVQLSRDSSFAQTILDQTVDVPRVSSGQLAVGTYWWRVQAIPADGSPAAWSRPSRIEFESRSPGGNDGGSDSGEDDETDASAASGVFDPQNTAPVVLNVPQIYQHKDSHMLLLESQQPGGLHGAGLSPAPPHTWDRDHGALNPNDPADNMSCGLASMAMMNRFYGGDLAQDRIGYEVFGPNVRRYQTMVPAGLIVYGPLRELAPGPERDLMYGYGLADEKLVAAGIYALGALPGPGSGFGPGLTVLPTMWTTIVAEIDAHRPVIGRTETHYIVIRGYEVRNGRQLVYVNDPWSGPYLMDLRGGAAVAGTVIAIYTWPSHPAIGRLEPEFDRDTDSDGVTDFDESNRFHTNPNNQDTDGDGVHDKEDIESGVYESEFRLGYAWNPSYGSAGRDFDADGKPTELDPDSDNGGCKDGDEDVSHDGYRENPERGNFNQADDECGPLRGNLSYAIDLINTDPDQLIKEIHDEGVILVRLKPESPGSDHYVDDSSRFNYRGFARTVIDANGCNIVSREIASGGGLFTPDGEIGATRGDDSTLALGAGADVPGHSSTSGCGPISGSQPASRRMAFPECTGRLDPAGPRGMRTYRFDCRNAPVPPGPGWTVIRYFARGFVRIQ